mgnify:CR=1 FL=1
MPTKTKKTHTAKRGRPKKAAILATKKKTEGHLDTTEQAVIAPVLPESEILSHSASETPKKVALQKYIYSLGRRKTAMAKIKLFEQPGEIRVNNRDYRAYFPGRDLQKIVLSPLIALGLEKQLSAQIFTKGGGTHAQAEAVRHGISRALVLRKAEDKPILKKSGYLTRDPRVKERKKPGLKRARRGPQWSKR